MMKSSLLFIPFLIVLAAMSAFLALPVMGQTPENRQLYMPVAGRAMLTGPVFTILAGLYLPNDAVFSLDFFDGVSVTEVMSTTRGSAGWYIFDKVPLLEEGQYYQVSYYNGRYGAPNPDNATIAKGPKITTSVAGGFANGGPVLIYGGITLLTPSDGRQYAISHPLEWQDGNGRYYVTIYDLQGNTLYETEPRDTDKAYFFPLPPELSFNTPYIWQVSIENEDGTVVINNKSRREVTFVAEEPLPAPTNLWNTCGSANSSFINCDFFWSSVGENIEYAIHPTQWVTSTQYTRTVLCDTDFVWRVKARTETAESAWSIPRTLHPDCYSKHLLTEARKR